MGHTDVAPETLAGIKASFRRADAKGDGFIRQDHLLSVLDGIGQWTQEELDELVKLAVADLGVGKINYNDFVDWVLSDSTASLEDAEQPSMRVAGVETTLFELAADGVLVRRLSQRPLSEVQSILLVVDPRALSRVTDALRSIIGDVAELARNVTTFVLLPSSATSTRDCILRAGAEPFASLAPPGMIAYDVRIVRTDDYLRRGDAVIIEMMEQGWKVHPAREVDEMLSFVSKSALTKLLKNAAAGQECQERYKSSGNAENEKQLAPSLQFKCPNTGYEIWVVAPDGLAELVCKE
mmetsp:Transcript_36263/g.71653  ORF Transcript_36263/g.71653 Transcript_36263/m.71653 type:complete len:295 (+) Transcript_36263:57-941(+)